MYSEKVRAFKEQMENFVETTKQAEDKLIGLDGEIENRLNRLAILEKQLAEQAKMGELAKEKQQQDLSLLEQRAHENLKRSELKLAEADSLRALAAKELLNQREKHAKKLDSDKAPKRLEDAVV